MYNLKKILETPGIDLGILMLLVGWVKCHAGPVFVH